MDQAEGMADDEAARWVARLNARSVTTSELDAFYAWRREPGNARAFTRAERVWRDAKQLGDDPEIADAVRDALGRSGRDTPARTRRALLAAMVALPIAIGAGWWSYSAARVYETAPGEQLVAVLDDGSRVRLNTDTRIAVSLGRSERIVTLARGEAFFEVKSDPKRPFRVLADANTVTAIGTGFLVRRMDGAVSVTLTHGKIELSENGGGEMRLGTPGDRVILSPGSATRTSRVNLESALGWTTGKLVFHQTPLGEAVAEANRYARRRIVLDNPELASLKVDGVFDTNDTDSFVAAVATLLELSSISSPTEVRLRRANHRN